MKNKTIGIFLISSVVIALIGAVAASSNLSNFSEFLYSVSGLGLVVFGIWGGMRLTSDAK